MLSITILCLPDCLFSGVIGPLEIFAIANQLAEGRMPQDKLQQSIRAEETMCFFPVQLASLPQAETQNFTGIPLPVQTPYYEASADIIIIPPIFANLTSLLSNSELIRWLQEQHEKGTVIATCCAGSFLLAETGLLDGKSTTTHWQLASLFQQRYPQVELMPQMMLIDGGHYICAGGAMAWQDLSLHIIARFLDGEIAADCAKKLVMDGARQLQTPYFMFAPGRAKHSEHQDDGIEHIRKWMQQHYSRSIQLEELADLAQITTRTLLRRFKKSTGQTPLNYLQQLRIEAARHLLEISDKSVEEITGLIGYTDSSSFRRLFKEKTGLTPKEYRNKFNRISL